MSSPLSSTPSRFLLHKQKAKRISTEHFAAATVPGASMVVTIFAAAAASMAEQWSSHHCLVDCAKDLRWVLPAR
ncbi:hypothetical protein DEO72_LG11g2152 [Vigna unguiculata]|uniref:Uncharacterized protein n=1 Tax=Vigna unguiculata TaxID=3917 RepID=A0A4D6NMT6_VIGUN|nr:hypothetical protein DEO72_LG11g2152 [Vigna unguiculata]